MRIVKAGAKPLMYDLLIPRIRLRKRNVANSKTFQMTKWYNWTTFDVIGDLAFGEPFGCLENSNYHPWVSLIFQSIKQSIYMIELRRNWPALDQFIRKHFMWYFMKKRSQHFELTCSKVAKRMASQEDRPDFMRSMISKDKEGKEVSFTICPTDSLFRLYNKKTPIADRTSI